MAKLEDRDEKAYMVWDIEFDSPALKKIYYNIGHAKNAVNNFYGYTANRNRKVVIAEIEMKTTKRKWFKHEGEWKELTPMNAFLYV